MSQSKESSALLEQALALHKQGKLNEAGALYRRVLEEIPEQPNALHLAGLLALQQERPEEAVAWLEKAAKANPNSSLLHRDLGLVFHALERFDEAVSAFRRAIDLQPHFPDALCDWGNLYLEFCHFEQALNCYEQALAQDPESIPARETIRGIGETRQKLAAFAAALREDAIKSVAGGEWQAGPQPTKLERRELMPLLLNELGLKGIGAEVGVQEGRFSDRILRHWEGKLLYSIDPWRWFPNSEYVDVANVAQSRQDELYRATLRKLLPFQNRSVVWRLTSNEASGLVADGSLDFCYIDADHSYEAVRQDIQSWWPKIRAGGILAGHDYVEDGTYEWGVAGVQRAVNEFVRLAKLPLYLSNELTQPTPSFPSWFVRKR